MTQAYPRIRVDGIPKGQPRPQAFARKMGDKVVTRVFTPGTAEAWKNAVAGERPGAVIGVMPLFEELVPA